MVFTSLSGSISHFREGNVNRRLGALLGLFGAGGAFMGAHISSALSSATLKPLTGAVLLISALLIYLRVFHPRHPLFSLRCNADKGVVFWMLTVIVGICNGLISGACGVGATPFIQLTLLIIFNVPLYQTVGTTMPLDSADAQVYLRWAVEAFRLASSGVADRTQLHSHMKFDENRDPIKCAVIVRVTEQGTFAFVESVCPK